MSSTIKHKENTNKNSARQREEHWRRMKRMYSTINKGRYFMKSLCPLVILVLSNNKWQAEAQCPVNTMTSFERIGGVTVKDSLLSVLYTAPNISSLGVGQNHFGADLTRQLAVSLSSGSTTSLNIPITAECNNRCRRSIKCRAFLVDYARHTCYSIEHPASQGSLASQTGLVRTPTPIHLVPTQERTSYFEKVCLNLPAIECERAWIYERVMAYHIHGHDDKLIDDVPSRLKCQEHCLNEREFRCRSGEYDYLTMQCRLSTIDRHIKPNSFRPTTSNVDYFENQCAPVGNQCDAFDRYEDMDLGRAEIMRSANTSDQCQQFCTQTIKAFICRSFTWNPITGKCYLNSANSFMVGGMDRLISAPGLIYYQRNDCIDLKLECDTTAMTLNLRTNEPFRGRMYVRDDPNSCETLGRSSLTSSLSIPFQSHARCATRELPSRYSSVVVVQQHPLIQRKSDRYIKVVCDFQTANKTITSSYNVVANPWTSTAFINATSFAPKIRLKITDKFGVDITGAKLGDELYLRIEAETDSVYDMVARSVLAKSGTTDESIVLIDKDGCPTDFRIFPPLKKISRRTIVGKFDAFKFSSDVVVRFQVDVQFCLNQCPATNCDHNMLLNINPSQLADGGPPYDNNNIGTTTSPTTSSNGALMQPDSSLVAAGGGGSTQTPVPFHQRATSDTNDNNNHRTSPLSSTANNFSSASSAHYSSSSPYAGGPTNSLREPIYYNSARHPSVPANYPLTNYTTNSNQQQAILDSLAPTSDPQMFEPSLVGTGGGSNNLNSVPMLKSVSDGSSAVAATKGQQRQHQQQIASNSIDNSAAALPSSTSDSGSDLSPSQDQQQQNSHRRRRRRSAEPMPPAPRNVPLQREIIVESSPTPSARREPAFDRGDGQIQNLASTGGKQRGKSLSGQRGAKKSDMKADGLTRNGPAYDLNGNKIELLEEDQQQQVDNNDGTLLCTTRNSLVIASMAFCTVQFLTVALCLVTWMHRRDAKFKVKHPIEERLY